MRVVFETLSRKTHVEIGVVVFEFVPEGNDVDGWSVLKVDTDVLVTGGKESSDASVDIIGPNF
jgi:hypothetical protein